MSITTALQNVRSSRTICTISAALIWSANDGSSGAGRISSPDGSWRMRNWLEERGVEPVERADGVDDRVLRRQLEHHGHVAELQVGVDEDHGPVLRPLGQDHGQVGGEHRLAGAALGGEHGDDLGQGGRRRLGRRRPPAVGTPTGAGEVEALGHPRHGGLELRRLDRRGQDVVHARPAAPSAAGRWTARR